MSTSLRPLAILKALRRSYPGDWGRPQPFGSDGWMFAGPNETVIVTASEYEKVEWVHCSMSRPDSMPTYSDLVALHRAVFGPRGHSYQVFVPSDEHVNIHSFALHLFGRLDGTRVLPDFTRGMGSI